MKKLNLLILLTSLFLTHVIIADTIYVGAARTYTTLQDAINAHPAITELILMVDPGIYLENIDEPTKRISIIGAGSNADPLNNTIIRKNANSPIIRIYGNGTASDPITYQDIRIEPDHVIGLEVAAGVSTSDIRLENVKIIGYPGDALESEVGLWIRTDADVDNLEIINTTFSRLDMGLYFQKHGDWGPGTSNVSNFTMRNSSITNNDYKGAYIEKLTDALFENVTVSNNGNTSYWNDAWNAGIDINLKGDIYQNISFQNCTITNNALGFREGAGLMIKARDDGGTYGANPATLNNVLITGGTVTGNERGIRLGEPNRNNNGPTAVIIRDVTIDGNNQTYPGIDGSAYGGIINQTLTQVDAILNFWRDDCSGPTHTLNPPGTGDDIYGDVLYFPWNCDIRPVAVINSNPNPPAGLTPLSVILDCYDSYDPLNSLTTCQWDLGNGETLTGMEVSSIYTDARRYTATLTVSNIFGNTDTASIIIDAYDYTKLTANIFIEDYLIKANGKEQINVYVQVYYRNQLLREELDLRFELTNGSLITPNIQFDRSTGKYFVNIISGTPGNGILSVFLGETEVLSETIYYWWITPPRESKFTIYDDSATYIKLYAVKLEWQQPVLNNTEATIAGYKIYRKTNGSDWVLSAELPPDTLSYLDKTTTDNVEYYIVAVDQDGDVSEPSNMVKQ